MPFGTCPSVIIIITSPSDARHVRTLCPNLPHLLHLRIIMSAFPSGVIAERERFWALFFFCRPAFLFLKGGGKTALSAISFSVQTLKKFLLKSMESLSNVLSSSTSWSNRSKSYPNCFLNTVTPWMHGYPRSCHLPQSHALFVGFKLNAVVVSTSPRAVTITVNNCRLPSTSTTDIPAQFCQ